MFLNSFTSIALLLSMTIPGFLVVKAKLLDAEKSVKGISVILLYICQPFITFNAFLNTNYNSKLLINIVAVFLFTTIFLISLTLIWKAVFTFILKKKDAGVEGYAATFGNIGYLLVPFLQMFMPGNTEVLLYASTAIIAFNLVGWTVGSYGITNDKKHINLKKVILNPATLSFLAVLPFFFLNLNFIRFPELSGVRNIVELMSKMVAPLAMVMLGMKIAEIKPKELLKDAKSYLAVIAKLIISPVLAFAITLLMGTFMDVSAIRFNLVALAAMPTANNLIMFCSLYGKDTALSSRLVVISTLFSIITIPLALTFLT